jgi:alginate O-acetyltransferase complex protein AlgI
MLFIELRYFLFFAVAFCVYWGLWRNGSRKFWLLCCSYFFYGAWDWRFLFLIVVSTAIDFVAGAMIAASRAPDAAARKKFCLVASLVANLGILGFFKYFGFFVESAAGLLQLLGSPMRVRTLSIVLPVGISFFTFQSMSYTIDIYRGKLEPVRSFVDFALFVAFFPQLVAGPIVRAAGFLSQLTASRRFADVDVRGHLALFLVGFIKKACVADHLAGAVEAVYASPASFGAGSKWLATALFQIQLYCDFSGYTDMAIASAGLLGYQLTRNFDFPYLTRSIRAFWQHWHISLTSWFRDYLFIPLGGNRGTLLRTCFNLLLVFALVGLWHGAAWTFVVFGLYHGILLVCEQLGVGRWLGGRRRVWQHAYMLSFFLVSLVLFRAPDLSTALAMLGDMFTAAPGPHPAVRQHLTWLWALAVPVFAVVHAATHKIRPLERLGWIPASGFALAYGAAWALVLPWVATRHEPFIYFQF